ncbi:RNA polymerase sigma factor [Paraconexibacter sp. AEG42_29]|uniref:RNA polymerase sigma factor n=1 Tax=Paraconexibacter sp. AEG42_29 TaxID=2997339 RepID=A0AAU7AWH5_9ACTN
MMSNGRDDSDADLLAASGVDGRAFEAFYRRHERLVLGWLIRRAPTVEDAADLTAETFAAAWLARDKFVTHEAGAAPWLLGIAQNKLRMSARRRRIERDATLRLGLDRVRLDERTRREIEQLFSDADAWLADLPADQREAVSAFVLDDERYADIAQRLQIGQPAVRKRVSRGLARLRHNLTDQGAR